MRVVYITFPSKDSAKELAKILLKSKLIACANIYEIDSLYNWEGKIADETEFVLWAKTTSDKISEIEKKVQKHHSYDIPCIVNFDAGANDAYAQWVKEECK